MEFIKNYILTLTANGPLHIGSGQKCKKKEYLHNKSNGIFSFVAADVMMNWIIEHNFVEKYENFMLYGNYGLLEFFQKELKTDPYRQIPGLILYSAKADPSITSMDVTPFIKDAMMRPYIPGSSIKGALRTVLLTKMIRDGGRVQNLSAQTSDKKREAARISSDIENRWLNRLSRNRDDGSALNSIMAGISISDSPPLNPEELILCKKIDAAKDGEAHSLPILRESLRPGTVIKCVLTIKPELCGGIDLNYIRGAILEFGSYYKTTFLDKFTRPYGAAAENLENCIPIGGGCGYFAKNVIYPGRDYSEALNWTADLMSVLFEEHNHRKDRKTGVSPRTVKYGGTYSNGRRTLRQVGLCRFEIEEMR